MNWRWLAGWALTATLTTLTIGYLWAATPGVVPVLVLFAGFWVARPMTWESEFEVATRQLRKAR